MKLSLPSWLTAKPATLADHEAVVDAAKADIVALADAKAIAQREYDSERSAQTENGLLEAEAAERRAQLRLESSQRALDAAREREAARVRQVAEARIAEIDEQLARPAVLAEGAVLEERECDLLLQLTDVRADRAHLSERFSALARERYSLLLKIGRITPSIHGNDFQHRSTLLTADRVVDSLRERLAEIPRDDERHVALCKIIESMGGDPRPLPARSSTGAA